jgi:ATP-binding protein involved in chromosome partitioning
MKDLIDPRDHIIKIRISQIENLIPVISYKGGVGKSVISSLLGLALNELGYKVGLLDLDFTNPSLHIILGTDLDKTRPVEEKGVLPPEIIERLKLMSIAFYTRDNPTPLRGSELTEVFKEIFTITIWRDLDYLIIDMPPTLTDVTLNMLNYFRKNIRPLIISSASLLSIKPTINIHKILREIKRSFEEEGLEFLGFLSYDPYLEKALGSIDRLRETRVYKEIRSEIVNKVVNRVGR